MSHLTFPVLQMEDKRRTLHKNLDLMESIETLNKWCATASEHLDRDEDIDRPVTANAGGTTEAVLGAVSNCNGPTDTFSQVFSHSQFQNTYTFSPFRILN